MISENIKALAEKYPFIRLFLYPVIIVNRCRRRKKYSLVKKTLCDLGRFLVGDPVIRIAEFQGVFAISVRSHLLSRIIMENQYEVREAALCLKYLNPDRDVIDIGANVGFYSVLCAKNIERKKVLAVEPAPEAIERLRRNIHLNNVADKVEIFTGVISNREGMTEIKIVRGREEYSSIGVMAHPSIANADWITEKVASTTLDALVEEKSLDPGFIKLDVEGVEHFVLEGAKKVLSVNRPIILSEIDDFLLRKNGSSARELIRLIAGYEYDVVDTAKLSIVRRMNKMGNILCFPKELSLLIQ